MEYRAYQPGDEKGITDLLNLVFPERRNLDWWSWYYGSNPAGEAIIHLAIDGDRVVGHRALVPYRLWHGGVYKTACQATDAATHPDYRGQGIFQRLTREVLAEATARGWSCVFSFPNENSLPINLRLGWTVVKRVRKWVKPLHLWPLAGVSSTASLLVEREQVDEEYTCFWEEYGMGEYVGLCKDAAYLNWRYCRNPGRPYTLLARKKNGSLKAYAVVTVKGRVGHLLEFMPGEVNPVLFLAQVEHHLAQGKVGFLTIWPLPEVPVPIRHGYLPNPRRAGVFALRPLAEPVPQPWRITPGDADYA